MRNLKNKNIEVQQIPKEQDIENVLEFLSKHSKNYGNIFEPHFNVIDITEYCKNFDESNQLFLISSESGWLYFYTRELGLIEMTQENGGQFIPEFLPIEPDEFNTSLNKLSEYGKILNLVALNRFDENESVTIGNNIIEFADEKVLANDDLIFRKLVTSTNEAGCNKYYYVDEYYFSDGHGGIKYEYKKIDDVSHKRLK